VIVLKLVALETAGIRSTREPAIFAADCRVEAEAQAGQTLILPRLLALRAASLIDCGFTGNGDGAVAVRSCLVIVRVQSFRGNPQACCGEVRTGFT
jgi:hypothetical protein